MSQPIGTGGIQFRPKGGEGPLYAPHRDLAYFWPAAMKEALFALDEANWSADVKHLQEIFGYTEAEFGDAVRRLVHAHGLFTGDPSITEPQLALEQASWFEVPFIIRMLITSRVGEVLMGGFFVAVKEVTRMGDVPPNTSDIADFIAAGRAIAARTALVKPREYTDNEHLQHEYERLRATHALFERAFKRQADMYIELEEKHNRLLHEKSLWKRFLNRLRKIARRFR